MTDEQETFYMLEALRIYGKQGMCYDSMEIIQASSIPSNFVRDCGICRGRCETYVEVHLKQPWTPYGANPIFCTDRAACAARPKRVK